MIIKIVTLLFCLTSHLNAQQVTSFSRWQLAEDGGIHWLEMNEGLADIQVNCIDRALCVRASVLSHLCQIKDLMRPDRLP